MESENTYSRPEILRFRNQVCDHFIRKTFFHFHQDGGNSNQARPSGINPSPKSDELSFDNLQFPFFRVSIYIQQRFCPTKIH
jgi:hypothetical protein